jgi:hypothetical protein
MFQMRRKFNVSAFILGLLSTLFVSSIANAETGTIVGPYHIEPAFGAPTQTNNGPSTTTTEVVAEKGQMPMLAENSDALLKAAEQRYADIVARGGFPKVPNGTYKKGSKGKGVMALNQRLFMEGYLRPEGAQGDFAGIFTSATEESVSRYQRNLGLAVTGKVDSATLFQLNVAASERLDAIRANIPRVEVYEKNLGSRYLVVNVPSQQIETVSNGRVYSRHNAIVGKPERPSPVVMTPISTVKFNPYWNAPVSIVERDIIPKLRSGTQILSDLNFKVFKGVGGPEIDPSTVDWSRAIPDNYAFRQEPGPSNAMATAKIEFLSPFGIYLHDTSEPRLFKTSNRFYSSGCIRVDQMPLLVQWVLNGQDGFGEAKIATMAETLEQLEVPLVDAPQLRVAYLTAWPATKNTVAFRHDIYQLDGTGFVVGQPMPVGEMSPDGQRFVLKPLPRQVPVEAAEAEGFGLFQFGSSKGKGLFGKPTQSKSLFGKPLLSDASKPDQPDQSASSDDNFTFKPTKGKKAIGLFDWEAYRKQKAANKGQSGSDQSKKIVKGDSKKLTKKKVKAPDITISVNDIPPEPGLDIPKKPAAKKPTVKSASCAATADGKLPAGCKPVVNAVKDVVKPKV